MRLIIRGVCALVPAAALAVTAPGVALAHQHRVVGAFETTVGWVEEPAFAGFRNAVQLIIERPAPGGHTPAEGEEEEAPGTPVTTAKLQVEVIFGERDGTQKTDAMELRPAFGSPGEYRGFLIPTDAGTYTFHIFGTIGRTEFDQYYTSGEKGKNPQSEGEYNDVREPAEVQFPATPPSNLDLEGRLKSDTARLAAAASSADNSASLATYLGIAGVVLGGIALLLAALRRPKKAS